MSCSIISKCAHIQGLNGPYKVLKAHVQTHTVTHPPPTSPATVTVKVVTSTESTKRHNAQEHLHQLTHTRTHECASCCLIRDSLRHDQFFFRFPPPSLSANADIIEARVVTPV